eukprot:11851593-Prorocentrum_lima.AAC.1
MICHETPGDGKKGEKYLFNTYNHRKGSPKYMGYWWTGSTWFQGQTCHCEVPHHWFGSNI